MKRFYLLLIALFSVFYSSGQATMCVGSILHLTHTIPGGMWSSGNIAVATVDAATGVVTGVATGGVTITYTVGATSYLTGISVWPPLLIDGDTTTACAGSSFSLFNNRETLTNGWWYLWHDIESWTSSDPSIATVDGNGIDATVTGHTGGTAIITYTHRAGCVATHTVNITTASCTGTPDGGVASSTPLTCRGVFTTLTLSGHTTCGTSLQWQSSVDGVAWANVTGAISATSKTTPTVSSYYRCKVTCISSGLTSYSSTTYVEMRNKIASHTAVLSSPTCSPVEFSLRACISSTSNLTTYFGDGTSQDTVLDSASFYRAYFTHTYELPGAYSVKHVLHEAGLAVDSVTFPFVYNRCSYLPIMLYLDANSNCIKDSTEWGRSVPVHIRIDTNGVFLDSVTVLDGMYYQAFGSPGTIYRFTLLSALPGMSVLCPATGYIEDTIHASSSYTYPAKYFSLSCSSSPGFDLGITLGSVRTTAWSQNMWLVAHNGSCTPQDGIVKLYRSPKFPVIFDIYPSPSFISDSVIKWNFSALTPLTRKFIWVQFRRPFPDSTALLPGDTAMSGAEISPSIADLDPTNNSYVRFDPINTSYDPNDISVSPAGNILNGTQLEYTVRFENTGNDTAYNIHVMDTLSDDLDPASLELVMASAEMHLIKYKADGHTILKFDFPNIKLPDSSHHGFSDGMVVYRIKAKTGLPHGHEIPARVGIYFDYNEVVLTNTAISTILIPAVSITAGTTTVCATDTVVFTATSASIKTPRYQWMVNGVPVGTDTAALVLHTLANGDNITCNLRDSGNDTLIATSDATTMTVNPLPVVAYITGPGSVCPAANITLAGTSPGGVWSVDNPNATISAAGVLTGVTPGTVTVAYAITNSCGTGTGTTNITVTALPVAGTVSGPLHVCVGAAIIHSVTATGGYWYASNPNATVSSSGVVTGVTAGGLYVSYTVVNACGAASAAAPVIVDPLPNPGSLSGAATVCEAAAVTIVPTIIGGSWSASGSAAVAGGIVTGITAGTASISYAVTNMCGTDYVMHSMTINPLPVAGTITGADSVCEGSSTILSPSLAGGSWSSSASAGTVSDGTVTGISPGSTTISYAITNGCGTATAAHPVIVNPLPHAGTITGADSVCEAAGTILAASMPGGVWSSGSADATVAGGVVTGVTAGTATIIWTVTNSCGTDFTTHDIVINPLPHAGTVTGVPFICPGATTILSTTVAGGTWHATGVHATVAGAIATGVSPGDEVISYTVTNSCGTDVTTYTLTVHLLPNAGTIAGAGVVCLGDTILLSATSPGGVWSKSNSNVWLDNGRVAGMAEGSVSVSYTVTNDCGTHSTSVDLLVHPCPDGIGVVRGNLPPHVYPNPAANTIIIAANPLHYQSYQLSDNTGRKLRQGAIYTPETGVDVTSLMPGVYIIRTEGSSGIFVQKVIKL